MLQNLSQSQEKEKPFSRNRSGYQTFSYKNEESKARSSKSSDKNINEIRFSQTVENERPQRIFFEGVPSKFDSFVEKVYQFWPNDVEDLVKYFEESEKLKSK